MSTVEDLYGNSKLPIIENATRGVTSRGMG